MSEHIHTASIVWRRDEGDFAKGRFSRLHTWRFDGGVELPASATPSIVPLPMSVAEAVDPEEAFVASLASCHMLTFLFLASKRGFQVGEYEDNAIGILSRNERGVPWISSVTLNPKISYGGEKIPNAEEEDRLHHDAHEQCFIANSVKTEVSVKAR